MPWSLTRMCRCSSARQASACDSPARRVRLTDSQLPPCRAQSDASDRLISEHLRSDGWCAHAAPPPRRVARLRFCALSAIRMLTCAHTCRPAAGILMRSTMTTTSILRCRRAGIGRARANAQRVAPTWSSAAPSHNAAAPPPFEGSMYVWSPCGLARHVVRVSIVQQKNISGTDTHTTSDSRSTRRRRRAAGRCSRVPSDRRVRVHRGGSALVSPDATRRCWDTSVTAQP